MTDKKTNNENPADKQQSAANNTNKQGQASAKHKRQNLPQKKNQRLRNRKKQPSLLHQPVNRVKNREAAKRVPLLSHWSLP